MACRATRGVYDYRETKLLSPLKCFTLHRNLVRTYGLLDVLDRLRTKVRELQRQDFPYLIIGHTGDAQPASPRKRLQSSRDVHPITEQVTGADHHVTNVDAYAEVDLTVLSKPSVRLGQGTLSLHSAANGINRAAKLRQNTVASRVGYAAPMRRNQPV